MSRSRYVTGLRAVEQLLATDDVSVTKLFVEYRSANPRVAAIVKQARSRGVELQEANRGEAFVR